MTDSLTITIAGAGSIGCFIGGLLLKEGHVVNFLGRKRILDEIRKNGLHLSDYRGLSLDIDGNTLNLSEKPEIMANSDIVLVCTKSAATEHMANLISDNAMGSAIIVSLQNGLRNIETLREKLTNHDVRAGMVGFNVISAGNGCFHRGTSGDVVIESGEPNLGRMLWTSHITIDSSPEIADIQAGKLLMNLNNAVNALSGVPLKEQIRNRDWRLIMAAQISEGIAAMNAIGINPNPPAPVPVRLLPHILRLPNMIFEIVAKRMLDIDPKARSSMAEDIDLGRKTEIDEFQGEIIRMGKRAGVPTPVNQDIFDKVRDLETPE